MRHGDCADIDLGYCSASIGGEEEEECLQSRVIGSQPSRAYAISADFYDPITSSDNCDFSGNGADDDADTRKKDAGVDEEGGTALDADRSCQE